MALQRYLLYLLEKIHAAIGAGCAFNGYVFYNFLFSMLALRVRVLPGVLFFSQTRHSRHKFAHPPLSPAHGAAPPPRCLSARRAVPFPRPARKSPHSLSQTQPLRGCSSAKGLQVSGILAPLVWRVRRALPRCASPARTRRPRRDASARCRSCCRNRCPCRRCCQCFRSWSRFRPAPLQAGR